MAASNLLLQLVARLQHDPSVTHGRRILLDYVRKSSGARLALLFLLRKNRQALVLLEQSGRHPRHASPGGDISEVKQGIPASVQNRYTQRNAATQVVSFTREQPEPSEMPLNGLFGSALNTPGLQYIPNIDSDPRCLEAEKYWTWRAGQVIVSPIGTGRAEDDARGVLVLSFAPGRPAIELDALKEGNLLICISLLSAYLVDAGEDRLERDVAAPHAMSTKVDGGERPPLISASAAELQAAIDQERSRIARDLHDGAAQNIAYAIHKLEYVRRVYERQPQLAQRELNRARDVLIDTLRDLRHGISSLLPVQLEEQGVEEAIQGLLDEFRANAPGITVAYEVENLDIWPPSLEVPVYRLIQEALNNVRKHAHATRVSIRIRALTGLLTVEVSDNGSGFVSGRVEAGVANEAAAFPDLRQGPHSRTTHVTFGLKTMQERVRQAGGMVEIASKPGKGTTVKARFPLKLPSLILTRREREVLQLLVEGATNRVIAQKLSVSMETVKSHVHHIMQKMQVKDRTQAAVVATKQRWL